MQKDLMRVKQQLLLEEDEELSWQSVVCRRMSEFERFCGGKTTITKMPDITFEHIGNDVNLATIRNF